MGIGEKKGKHKKRDIKSVTQYGWGFRFLLKAVYTEKEKEKKREKRKKKEFLFTRPDTESLIKHEVLCPEKE